MHINQDVKPINIINIIERMLNYVDDRLIDHGNRVAYILFRVLMPKNKFSDKELCDLCILAMLHDIGAYKTEEIDNMVEFETIDVWNHSIYGYLFLKYFSPLSALAPVILYHHADCDEINGLKDVRQQELAQLISLCDRADVFSLQKGTADEFSDYLSRSRGKKWRDEIVDMFIESGFNIEKDFGNISTDKEYYRIFNNNHLTEEETEKYIKTLIYSIEFRSSQTFVHTVSTVCIANVIAGLLGIADETELEKLYYASVFHDIGKVGMPLHILESTGRYTDAEMEVMKAHTNVTEKILDGNVSDEIKRMSVNHHEKLNGSGYPRGLDAKSLHQYDRIIAISDIISALCRERNYKEAYPKEKTIAILNDMSGQNLIDSEITDIVNMNFDLILDELSKETQPVRDKYQSLNEEYQKLSKEKLKL